MNIKRVLLLSSLVVMSPLANATKYVVSNTQLDIYAESKSDDLNVPNSSYVYLIQSSQPIFSGGNHPWCINRAYIRQDDKELYATALAASISKTPVNFMYEDAAPRMTAPGHIAFTCKVVSIWSGK